MTRTRYVVLSTALLGLAVTTTACSANTAPAPQPAPAATPTPTAAAGSRCDTPDLRTVYDTSDGVGTADMQGSYYPLRFTNTSSRTCTLQGAPGLSWVDTHGNQMGQPARRVINPRVVSLAPGQTATAVVAHSSAEYKSGPCAENPRGTLVHPAALKVFPPDAYQPAVIPDLPRPQRPTRPDRLLNPTRNTPSRRSQLRLSGRQQV